MNELDTLLFLIGTTLGVEEKDFPKLRDILDLWHGARAREDNAQSPLSSDLFAALSARDRLTLDSATIKSADEMQAAYDKAEAAAREQIVGAEELSSKPHNYAGEAAHFKRATMDRLCAYCRTPGAKARIATAANGAVTVDELHDMLDAKRFPVNKWRVVSAALDALEKK